MKAILKSLFRHPLNSSFNVIGFALALSVAMLVALYSYHQLSANQSHKDIDRIQKVSGWGTPYAMTPFIGERFPEIEAITAVRGYPNIALPVDTTKIEKITDDMVLASRGMMLVDKEFFNVFTIPIVSGSIEGFFDKPNNIVISQTLAKNIFGTKNPIGAKLYIPWGMVKVANIVGVCKDFSENDSFCFDILLPVNTAQPTREGTVATDWISYGYESFAKVRKGVDLSDLQERIQKEIKENGNLRYDVAYVCFYPFDDLFFRGDLNTRFAMGDRKQVNAMIWVAIIVIVLAIINFFNLSTASATLRTKEIGIRKINGGTRKSLVWQFIGESVMLTAAGFVLAFGITNALIPWFNSFVGVDFDFIYLQTVEQWVFMIGAIIAIGTIAGSYPAFYLSGFNPLDVLFTNRLSPKGGVIFVRKGLIILQLAASIAIVICTIAIGNQLKYLLGKDLGFDKKQILFGYSTTEIAPYVSELNQLPFVEGVALTTGVMGSTDNGTTVKALANGEEKEIIMKQIRTDTAIINTFGLELISGRMFRADEPFALVINEEAARQCPQGDALNTIIKSNADEEYKIVGVVKDFHFKSLHNNIEPLMMYNYDPNRDLPMVNIRISKTAIDSLHIARDRIIKVAEKLGAQNSNIPMSLDESLENNYAAEKKFLTSFNIFSILAVFISCFGLFGLTVFTNNRRRREIALRKVHGSTTGQIIGRLIKSYLSLWAIASLVAVPTAYYVTYNYLKDYPYKAEFSVVPYLIGILGVGAVMLLTVAIHSWISARINPARTISSN